jgi:hypothetical protein
MIESKRIDINIRIKRLGNKSCRVFQIENNKLIVNTEKEQESFNYDNFYSDETNNWEIFEGSMKNRLDKFLGGVNVTFLFFGKKDKRYSLFENNPNLGLGSMAVDYIIDNKNVTFQNSSLNHVISVAYIQIFQEGVIIFKI